MTNQRKAVDTKTVFSTKSEKYAKYRWDYVPEAIEALVEITHLSSKSTIADIGAGTGILTKHFIYKVQRIWAIEPNLEMRQILKKEIGIYPSVSVLDASAENTRLPDRSVDVITVAQAIHWFDPEPARREMMRILKKAGWLALVRNFPTNEEQNEAVASLMSEDYGADLTTFNQLVREMPNDFYFGNTNFQKISFPFQLNQNWEEFIGALTTVSYMPDENHPLFDKLEKAAKKIFSIYSKDGNWMVEGETELIIGQPSE